MSVTAGSNTPLKPTPRWRRELRILRRDGLWKYLRGRRALRRFHKSVAAMDEGHEE